MEGVSSEIKIALEEIDQKLKNQKELTQKDLLTLLADSFLKEEQ